MKLPEWLGYIGIGGPPKRLGVGCLEMGNCGAVGGETEFPGLSSRSKPYFLRDFWPLF